MHGTSKKIFVVAALVAFASAIQTSNAQTGGAASLSALYPIPPSTATGTFGTGTYTLTGTITTILNSGVSSNSFVIADGSASALVYNVNVSTFSFTPVVGENITATNIKDSPYQDSAELVTVQSASAGTTSFTINSTGNSVAPTTLTIAGFDASGTGNVAAGTFGVAPYAESLVAINDATLTTTTGAVPTTLATNTAYILTDSTGTTEFYGYKSDSAVLAAVNAANAAGINYSDPIDLTGYADEYFGAAEFYPLSISGTVSTPEPTSIALLGVSMLPILNRRRRRTA